MRWESDRNVDSKRIRWLGAVFSLLILVILFRTFTFQVLKREPWNSIAPKQYEHRVKLTASRGIIYDRHMNILAMDLPIFSLAIDPTRVQNDATAASVLLEGLGGQEEMYLHLLSENKDKSFVWVKRDITETQKNDLLKSKIRGLIPVKERKRVHPYEDLGRQVMGITNSEHHGVGGIEQAFDKILRGEDGWAIFQKDGLNRNFSSLDYPIERPKDGKHVVSTIDHLYQTIVEEELRRGVMDHRSKGGSAVLMDPFTGEVLSMASVVGERSPEEERKFAEWLQNRTLQIDFEPGSTFKIVAIAAALEESTFKPNSLIHCENGVYRLANHSIHDHNKKYAWLTLKQIMEVSSNIGMAKIGQKLGNEILYKYIQNFGFGNRTGIGLPSEVSGILRPVYRWTNFSTAMISFGQEISVTTLQMACMISVVANGGELMKPRIIKAVLDGTGEEVQTFSREVIRRVITENTANQLTMILQSVINRGNGSGASVKGVEVAGKTGTAQKSIPGFKGYFPGAYVSSFVGFWPTETPRFALVIVLDEPKEEYWGARSAAPIFSRIVTRMAGLPISPGLPEGNKNEADREKKKFVFSNYEEGVEASEKTETKESQEDSPYHIPKLVGLSVREALQKLAVVGVEARVKGSGVVVLQEPKPAMKIKEGMICYLTCQENIESELSR